MGITGRDDELALIRRVLHGGRHCGVMIVGAAGVGKTALAREALSRAASAGDRTSWFVGTESARTLPLGAFTGAISPDMCDPMPNVRRLIDSFVAQQHRRQTLIGVDDCHLLDELSAHVLHQVAQCRGARLVVTARAGGTPPDAVTSLWKDGLLARIDLEPLSVDSTRTLIETTLGGPVDSRSAGRLWKLTGGNALYLQQLVKDQVEGGHLRQTAGVWMWDDDVAVSQSMTDLLGGNLDQLEPGPAMVVDLLSQCEPLDIDVLCDLVDRHALEAAEHLHVVAVERNGAQLQARLAHPLYGELRRAGAGELYLSGLRGKLADRLLAVDDDDLSATVRRALLMLGSDLKPDPHLYLDAARAAMTLLDPDSAERFAAAAAECGVYEAEPIRAMTLFLLGRGAEAETMLSRLSMPGQTDAHHWATLRAANLTWMLGRPRDAAAVLAELADSPESPAEVAARLAIQAGVDAVLGDCEAARENARAALDSGPLTDLHAILASIALMMALGALGDVTYMTAVAERAVDRAIASFESSQMRFWFGGVYARACRLTGRVDECLRGTAVLAESARDVPGLAHANLAFMLGHAELVRGEIPNAVKLLHEALAGVQTHRVRTGLRPASYFGLAEAHAKLGEAEAAAAALSEARTCVPDDYVYMHTNLALATGWTQAASGALSDAVATVRKAADEARERNQPTHELACLQAAAQWGDGFGASRARELADELEIPIADAVARHTEALCAGDGPGLLDASTRYRDIGDRTTAADVAAQAAVVLRAGGSRKRSLFAAAVASQLATECGGLCTPALRDPAGQPLTRRQREIVEFAVAGMSNREIADRLYMSVRSVEGHLYRACQRVGASSREELAAIVRSGPMGAL